jgi:hypothetical protein
MTDKLSLFNGALTRHIGNDKLADLSENRPERHALDLVWDDGAVDTCLQQGQFDFAARTVKIEFEPSVTPPFGHTYAFERPSDLIRIMAVCSDEFLRCPLMDYVYEGAYWYASIEAIYVRFVSNDASYGGDFSLWPPNFTRYVECHLAHEACQRIKGMDPKKREQIAVDLTRLLRESKATDAMENPVTFPPRGTWANSRGSRSGDRGKRNQLIG